MISQETKAGQVPVEVGALWHVAAGNHVRISVSAGAVLHLEDECTAVDDFIENALVVEVVARDSM